MELVIVLRAFLFYLIPLSWGGLVFFLYRTLSKKPSQSDNKRSISEKLSSTLTGDQLSIHQKNVHQHFIMKMIDLTIEFSVGLVAILIWALVCQWVQNALIPNSFNLFFFGVSYLIFIGMFFKSVAEKVIAIRSKQKIFLGFGINMITVAPILIATVAAWLWSHTTATPLNWDLYEHQTLATIIQNGSFSFFTSQLSDTFGFMSYPPTFHALLALSQFGMSLTGENILQYWNALSIVHTFSVAYATFLLALVITKRLKVAVIAVVFSVFIFEGIMAFTSHFPLPQNLTATLWALVLAGTLWREQRGKSTLPLLLFGSLALVLNHFVIGIVSATLLWSTVFFKWLSSTRLVQKNQFSVLISLLTISTIAIVLSYDLNFSAINRGEAAAFSFTFGQKLKYLYEMYSLLPLLLIPAVWSFIKKRVLAEGAAHTLLILTVVLGALVLSGIPYAFKFITLLHFPLVVMLAVVLSWLLLRAPRWLAIYTALALGIVLLTFTASRWQSDLIVDGYARHVSQDDLQAAVFLQKNYEADETLIISDPSTQYVLEGLSGVNSAGGAFAGQHQRQVLREQYANNTIDTDALYTIADKTLPGPATRLFVLSGRTYNWFMLDQSQQNALDFNVWRPQRLSFYDSEITFLLVQEKNLSVVYQNPSYVIIELE